MATEPWGHGWPNESHEWLLQAALCRGARAVDCWRQWKETVDIDQLDGGSQAMLPLVHHNLTREGLDDPLLPFCKGFYRRTWYLNNLNFHHMTGVLRALHQVGIRRLLLLKGAAMVVAHYRDHGLRAMGDFDFQVPLDQAAAVPAMLVDWGWRPKSPLPRPHGWDFEDAQERKLDIHWYSLHACTTPGDDDDFWAAAIPAQLADVPVEVLCPTDQLFQVIVHGVFFQGGTPLRWVADALTILASATDENAIDWSRFWLAARTRGLRHVLFEGLSYLRTRFDAAIPPEAIAAMLPPPPEPAPPPPPPPSLARRIQRRWQAEGAVGVMKKAFSRGTRALVGSR